MMKRILQTLALLLAALMVPTTAVAAYVQLADGVYQDGMALYICSNVTSLGNLQVNPSEIYCYAQTPPSCLSGTFTGYGATLHVPTSAMVSYFTAQYWYNFNNVLADAVEPQLVTMNTTSAELESGQQLSLSATVTPSNATPKTVYWSSTNTSVATVSNGVVIAVGEGECYIRAICIHKQAICHVAVAPQRTTITLDKQEARLLPNHTMTLTATCTPATTDLVVTSNNPAVAIPRYVNGTIMVVGVSEGTATITVSTANGWCYPAECQVTVCTEVGDLNSDGFVNMDDLTVMINYLLTNDATGINLINADTNLVGGVTMDDLTALINYLLTNVWPWDEPVTETFTVNGVSFKMVAVEGGTFMMGATAEQGSDAYDLEYPTHQVTLSSYSIGETEVTQALWLAVMGSNPSYFTPTNGYAENLQRPVEYVSWNDCQTFINKLNQMTGKNFRLPTEAEWEYAARGGKKSQGYKYAGSNIIDDVAWYSSNSSFQTHPVATKAPNELGLYDMSGNVCEWCQDWYGSYTSDAQTNPVGPSTGFYRVYRGGAWYDYARCCRVSYRLSDPDHFWYDGGLRLALDEENSPKFRLSETVVEIEEGRVATIDILNGSDSYSLAGGASIVTAAIDGEKLMVKGIALGTNTVYVTDNATGATAVLAVIVKESNDETFTVNGVSFKMVAVEGGAFMMGASDNDTEAVTNEKPAHQVTLSGYSIGETEVTQALWVAVMGSNPSCFTPTNGYAENLQRPVEMVSWNDCQEFIAKLNQMTGKNFRLPTEAEWEYAARGGKMWQGYKYAGSNDIDTVAWFYSNSYVLGSSSPDFGTHTVATKAPNELGLYDMSGNVWEWCQDWYGSYSSDAQTNPNGPVSGSYRLNRGGGWRDYARYCRVSSRGVNNLTSANVDLGLRLAFDEDNSPKFRLSETVVDIEEGETATVNILNGSGSYSVVGGIDIVSTTVNGETLTVTGTAVGTTTLYLTDNSTCTTTVLTIIVTEAEIQTVTYTVNGVSFKMVAVEGGTFTMGASDVDLGASDSEKPAHQVTLSSYRIGETEVTQALWKAVMGSNPSEFSPTNGYAENLQRPVEMVSWNDCQQFITKLNQMTGKNFRLPTEAEWEYAARGGKNSQGYKYAGSNDLNLVAWHWNNIPSHTDGVEGYGTQTVATKSPNELGLYDMSGNVWEWCQDRYGSYSSAAQTNPTGPASGYDRVGRGGSWYFMESVGCRVSYRSYGSPSDSGNSLGLRLAL